MQKGKSRVRVLAPEAGHGSAPRWGAERGDAATHEVDLLASPSGDRRGVREGGVFGHLCCGGTNLALGDCVNSLKEGRG